MSAARPWAGLARHFWLTLLLNLLSLSATFAFLLVCLAVIWWIFRTGYRLKQ